MCQQIIVYRRSFSKNRLFSKRFFTSFTTVPVLNARSSVCKGHMQVKYLSFYAFLRPSQVRCCSIAANVSIAQKLFPPKFVPIYKNAFGYLNRTAVIDSTGQHSYGHILSQSWILSQKITEILQQRGQADVQNRISFLCENDANYIVIQWACWISKNVAVPLSKIHPTPQLEYYVKDSQSSIIIATEALADKVESIANDLSVPLVVTNHTDADDVPPNELEEKLLDIDLQKSQHEHNRMKKQNALILYTSGTTGSPKGVVLTHGNLHAQISALVTAWEFSQNDIVLHALPLYHMHGILNALLCPLSVGGCCYMLQKFDAGEIWKHVVNKEKLIPSPNIFMGVPTMYVKLIAEYKKEYKGKNYRRTMEFIKATCLQNIRFMTCGSAPLPTPIMEHWEEITGHRLLERYGMTEIGMGLSNSLHGLRVPGSVGLPLPGVEVSIVKTNAYAKNGYDMLVKGNDRHTVVTDGGKNESGELLVKGPNVFSGYWNKPQATEQAFTRDGWFKTGDTARFSENVYHILGRTSVDIIKSGGYKISAIEVERHLMGHENIADCAVVGLPDITWGEKVAAVIVTHNSKPMSLETLQPWCKTSMPSYIIPTVIVCVPELPHNAMGKVNKKELIQKIFPEAKRF